jgi:predicted Zn-dependent peptidase
MKIIERTASSSNLKIILVPMPGTKTITAAFAVRAGWKYETLENHGIAHFLEHMTFRGTKKRPTSFNISKEIDSKGGFINAATSAEMTVYWIKFPYQYTKIALDILMDIISNSLFNPEEIEKERGAIIQEVRMIHDTPTRFVPLVAWPKLLYGDQPAGRLIVGTEESIKAMNRAHFVDFLENLYMDRNAALCLAGRIPNVDYVFSQINAFFDDIRKGNPAINKPPTIEIQNRPELFLETRDIQQSHIILGVRAYNLSHPKRYALGVLEAILGGNPSSRMYMEIREKRGLAYYVHVFSNMQSDVGSFGTQAGVDKNGITEVIQLIISEYQKICEEKIPNEELKRAKDYIIGSAQMSLESSSAVVSNLCYQWALEEKITSFAEESREIRAVTAEDIRTVAQEIFVNKGLNLAIVGPHQGMEEEFLKILHFD